MPSTNSISPQLDDTRLLINGALMHPNPTGLSRYGVELSAQLLQSYRHARLLTRYGAFSERFPQQTISAGPVFRVPANTQSNLARLWWEQTGMRSQAQRQRAQLLFSPIAEGMSFPPCPQIITVHDLLPLYDPLYMPRWTTYYRHILPTLIRQSHATVCVSEFTKQELLRHFSQLESHAHKLRVIPAGVNATTFQAEAAGQARQEFGLDDFVLLVGEGRPYKNVEVVVKALARLETPIDVAICGRMPAEEQQRIQRIAEQANVPQRLKWLGYVSDEALRRLYTDTLAFIFPSTYEGFGLPTLEAMACGAPVISSNAASLTEAGGDAALYFDPTQPDELAQQIQRLQHNAEAQARLRAAGRRRVQHFGWERSAQAHRELFAETLADTGA